MRKNEFDILSMVFIFTADFADVYLCDMILMYRAM